MEIKEYKKDLNQKTDIYRGKLKSDNSPNKKGDWVFGNFVKFIDGDKVSAHIYYFGEVFANTVGRCVGITDYDGSDVFDGDIIEDVDDREIGVVRWDNDDARFVLEVDNVILPAEGLYAYRVIGNIYDNPDLLNTPDELTDRDIAEIAQRAPIQTVHIPACDNHEGVYAIDVRLRWVCPKCGRARGKIGGGLSYDGSLCLNVNKWTNPCGHIDKYDAVRKEAAENGLNIFTEVIPPDRGRSGGNDD